MRVKQWIRDKDNNAAGNRKETAVEANLEADTASSHGK